MSEILQNLIMNGFVIYPKDTQFAIRKYSVPLNVVVIEEQVFDTYELALSHATCLLQNCNHKEWSVIVRYNRGLGIEYRNLSEVFAEDQEKAEFAALGLARNVFKDPAQICEIRVRLKN